MLSSCLCSASWTLASLCIECAVYEANPPRATILSEAEGGYVLSASTHDLHLANFKKPNAIVDYPRSEHEQVNHQEQIERHRLYCTSLIKH